MEFEAQWRAELRAILSMSARSGNLYQASGARHWPMRARRWAAPLSLWFIAACGVSDTGLRPAAGVASEEVPAVRTPVDYYLNTVSKLYALDPTSWEAVQVGSFSVPFIADTALSATGVLFATEGATLITVDPQTAELTWMNRIHSTSAMAGLADGRLITAGVEGVYVLEPATGIESMVAPPGDYGTVGDLAVLPDGSVYWVSTSGDGGFDLLRVDAADGVTVWVGQLDVNEALALMNVEGRLIGAAGDGAVFEIDPGTGAVTTLAQLSERWAGAASVPRSE